MTHGPLIELWEESSKLRCSQCVPLAFQILYLDLYFVLKQKESPNS